MAADSKFTYIKDLIPAMPRVNVQFIILDVGAPRQTKSGGEVRTIRVADKTGSVNVAIWNEIGSYLRSGDICRLINGFTSVHHNSLCLTCGRFSELQKVGEFCMTFSEVPFMSTPNPELAKVAKDQTAGRKRPFASNGNTTETGKETL